VTDVFFNLVLIAIISFGLSGMSYWQGFKI